MIIVGKKLVNNSNIRRIVILTLILASIGFAVADKIQQGFFVTMDMTFPQEGMVYDFNVTTINWTYSTNSSITNCTYNINDGTGYNLMTCSDYFVDLSLAGKGSEEGINIWRIRINFSEDGDEGVYTTSIRTFSIDTIDPYVNISYPEEGHNYSYIVQTINFSASDANLSYCQFTDGTITENISCAGINYVNSTEGNNTWNITVFDIVGRSNSTSVTFFVDSIFPMIQFVPITTVSGNYTQNWTFANVSAIDSYLDTISIYLFNGSGEILNISNSTSSPFSINFTELMEGIYYLNASANDTIGHINSTETRLIIIDNTAPIITLEGPNDWFNSTSVNFTFNVSDNIQEFFTCYLFTNETGNFVVEEIFYANNGTNIINHTLDQGNFLWGINCSDGLNIGFASSNLTVTVDTYVLEPRFLPTTNLEAASVLVQVIFNETVNMTSATFNSNDINMSTGDNQTFNYTATGLVSGNSYILSVNVSDDYNNSANFSHSYYASFGGGGGSGGGGGGSSPSPTAIVLNEIVDESGPSQICGDGVCQVGESCSNCEEDCFRTCLPDEPEVVDSEPEENDTSSGNQITGAAVGPGEFLKNNWWAFLIAFALAAGLILYFNNRKGSDVDVEDVEKDIHNNGIEDKEIEKKPEKSITSGIFDDIDKPKDDSGIEEENNL